MTAVEWLINHIDIKFIDNTDKYIEQAKEMEKEQHEKTWTAGLYCETGDRKAFIEYYNQTFKSE
jgi:hypothetical protein